MSVANKSAGFSAALPGALLVWICSSTMAWAVTVDNFVARRYTNSNGVLPYRLFIPTNYSVAQRFPLVLFMHGAGESGSDNRYQLVGQTGALVFASETNQLKHPSFMVAPQCPSGSSWTDTSIRLRVAGLMTALQNEFSIDADRLYITGLSLGGFGTWEYISRYPGIYAAAIPMSGSDTTGSASITRPQIPIWNFHAVDDSVVSEIGSSAIIDLLRRVGGNPIYTRYDTGGHAIWTFAYQTPILMDWVYAQRRGVASTLPPALSIDGPAGQSIYAVSESALSLTGSADDGSGRATAVTWANYRTVTGPVPTAHGTAAGTTKWAITNLPLFPTYTNNVVFLGSGTSWYSFLRGSTTFNKSVKVIFPPFIRTQPADQMVNEGELAQFSVIPDTLAPVPRFQWRLNGTDIPAATGATLILTNVHFTDAGLYSVQLSNQFGFLSSSNAVLAVNRFPVAQCADVIASAGSSCSASASVDHGSFDPDGDPITVTQVPPGPYPLGTNLVLLTVTDSKGTSNVCNGLVIVLDRTPPTIACRDIIVTNAHDQLSSVVTYNPFVSDACSIPGVPVCLPPSGSVFGLGNHSVLCSAADAAGNTSQCSFNVTVMPGNAPPTPVIDISPILHVSGYTNLIVVASLDRMALLVFDASLSHDSDDTHFSYSWSEGTNLFSTSAVAHRELSLGSHEITLTLDDRFPLGITRTNVTVEVITPSDGVAILVGLVEDSILSARNRQPLVASLLVTAASFERGNATAAANQLHAFENKVQAQVMPLDPALASELLRTAQSLIDGVDH